MNKMTIRTLGVAVVLATGLAGGSYAASVTNTAPATTTYQTTQPMPRDNSSGNAVADSRGNTTTSSQIGPRTMQTGDGRVGPAAPSAGAKVGGGSK
jgi:hypothetical protein